MTPYIYAGLSLRNKLRVVNNIPEKKMVNPDFLDKICDALDLDRKDLVSIKKTRDLAEARFIAVGLIVENPDRPSYVKIGKMFGRHHSTTLYHAKMYNDLMNYDKSFIKKVAMVKEYLNELI